MYQFFLQKCKLRQNDKCDYFDISNEDFKTLILLRCQKGVASYEYCFKFYCYKCNWKRVIIGFYVETNPKVLFYNTIISNLAFKNNKFKMGCRIKNERQNGLKLKQCV